jgi:hypothetical protein
VPGTGVMLADHVLKAFVLVAPTHGGREQVRKRSFQLGFSLATFISKI